MSKRKSEAPIDADVDELIVHDLVVPDTEPPPPPDDPVIFGGRLTFGGSADLTILPPGNGPDFSIAPPALEASITEPDPIGEKAEALYLVYHEALQGLPYPDFRNVSAAQNVAWRAVAQYVAAFNA